MVDLVMKGTLIFLFCFVTMGAFVNYRKFGIGVSFR